ncbi:hypothetical protein LINPERHAP1_LOCUS9680 [Linum perenne]
MEQEKMHGSGSASDGLSVGKMILMAGLVFTSAPVVVPGVLVVSAIGLACSVPYALFLATYSFTETLMTKLLPLQAVSRPDGDESLGMYGQKKDEVAEEVGFEDDDVRSVVVEEEKNEKEATSKDEDKTVKEDDKTADAAIVCVDIVPFAEAEHGAADSGEEAAAPQSVAESDGGGDANQDEADVAPTEVIDIEEKLWEQIRALRVIVGYSGSRKPTCVEELVALYVFTGVEPPATSFNDPRGLVADLSMKLRDLKLIVGLE